MQFDNSYARLPSRMHARLDPEPVPEPSLIAVNAPLAREMGLDPEVLASSDWVAVFAGNRVPDGAAPLAQAYAGHQFGGWVPQLGDGRAHLLGEHLGPDGRRWDIQLKGSGRTPFSRMGDGRAWLGPVLREYLVSEAMAALGVPTTRALAAVRTGGSVQRESTLPGAVLCRVADSHLRVGTFQYFAARQDREALELLVEMALARHYPGVEGALGLLGSALQAQARLVAQWMGLGFVHGVMNTDNAHVGGLTIDYGPCAFMDRYHAGQVFSSIDRHGRYAYANQPQIAVWNIAQLASTLLPLIDADQDAAVRKATDVVNGFGDQFEAAWLETFRAKLGLERPEPSDRALIEGLLDLLQAQRVDFTRAFRGLAEGTIETEFPQTHDLSLWLETWEARLASEGRDKADAMAHMRAVNPAIIPRNHRIEAAIVAAVEGDDTLFHDLNDALANPFDRPVDDLLRAAPEPEEEVRATFCGT